MHIEAWVNADTGKVKIIKPYKAILPDKGGYDVTASSYRTRKNNCSEFEGKEKIDASN